MSLLAPTLEAFLSERLIGQRQASPHTVASYRDTFVLLLAFAQEQTGRPPSRLKLEDLDAALIGAFLEHLEQHRHNSARTRNARLSAVHSMFRFAALRHPEHAALIARVLAIPPRRSDKPLVTFLTNPEVDALLAAPDRSQWIGRRDHALLLLAIQTGLRVSELTGLRCRDVSLGRGPHTRCEGKNRKERVTPLTTQTVAVLRTWLAEQHSDPADPLFPASHGGRLSRDAVERLLTKHAKVAERSCPSLNGKRVSPHTLRHTSAMRLLHAGVDTTVIALWLGHETTRTTDIYLHADLALKEKALARTTPPNTRPGRYRASDSLLAFLASL
ncbi:MAG: site-specific integrase [Actinobacteria bacterium]|nr:site-specific integrase [Actinomycetota bacterium]MCA1697464.1 site-specific integrase [Actinomycetota bacterium]